jgi:hypothetical protein
MSWLKFASRKSLGKTDEKQLQYQMGNAALKEHRGIGPAPGMLNRLCELGLHIRK